MDRYYTSIPLFQDLFAQRTVAVGTIMGNRGGLPKDLIQKKLGKGEIAARRHDALLVLKWRDKRDVLVLSSKHTPAIQDVLVRVPGGRVAKVNPWQSRSTMTTCPKWTKVTSYCVTTP